jgi:hypothetical protein
MKNPEEKSSFLPCEPKAEGSEENEELSTDEGSDAVPAGEEVNPEEEYSPPCESEQNEEKSEEETDVLPGR